MRKLLKAIKENRKNGYVMTHREAMMVQSDWLRLFGCGGCDCYPYTTEFDMASDLMDHYNI